MALIELQGVSLGFGGHFLFENLNLQINERERICLIGRNGTGKSSMLRVLQGTEELDAGVRLVANRVRVGTLPQEVPLGLSGTVEEVILAEGTHAQMEDWEVMAELDQLSDGLGITLSDSFETLSGGMKRRVLLAKLLFSQPEVLLLDEPTNHLDLPAILWLEETLLATRSAVFFVTHDRSFLQRLATRILELDRGRVTSWDCDYATFLARREAFLEAEEKRWALEDKKLAQEEAWLRQGIKARRTRNEGRVRNLERLREERGQRRERTGVVRMDIQSADRSGDKVLEAENLSFSWPNEKPIFEGFSITLRRGDKVGVIGRNGTGKTTLLRVLLGELSPSSGIIEYGTKLEVVYLDQMRDQINPELTVAENVAGDRETVEVNGAPRHVHGYLKDFLFPPDRIHMKANKLSGGERNRLLLAKLLLRPANVLVLDEPTNDLDTETLELLEDLLGDYEGTLILVSHDRTFLDNLVTSCLVFEEDGRLAEYAGGYSAWRREVQRRSAGAGAVKAKRSAVELPSGREGSPTPRTGLSKRELEELEKLPPLLEELEAEQADLMQKLGDPAVARDPGRRNEVETRLREIGKRMETAFARWEELEAAVGAQ
ncbi:MAG: ATP-binding cassette domain-containing protein [Puniceicoccaceae bacterium]